MKRIAHKTALHTLGGIFILIGIIGCLLPIIPGIPFFALGIYFISLAWLWLYVKIEGMKNKFPKIAYYYNRFDQHVGKYIKKAHY